MAGELSKLVADLLASPLGDVIASVGEGVAAAQAALDAGSVAQTLEIYSESGDEGLALLRSVGYRPTFYTLPETTGEIQVSLRLSGGQAQNGGAAAKPLPQRLGRAAPLRARMYATPVDAGFANQFNYSAQASAKIVFRIVPVPPPLALEDIRVVPALAGRAASEATLVLETLGLGAAFVDKDGAAVAEPAANRAVTGTEPAAQAIVPGGSVVTVRLK